MYNTILLAKINTSTAMSRSFLSVLAVSLILVVSTSNAIDSKTISQICTHSEIRNHSYCLKLLDPSKNPAIASSDLKGVAKIVLDRSILKAAMAKYTITSFVAKFESDPKRKKGLKDCANCYGEALGHLDKAKELLATNDGTTYVSVWFHVYFTESRLWSCHNESLDHDDIAVKEVWNETKEVRDTVSVALAISYILKDLSGASGGIE